MSTQKPPMVYALLVGINNYDRISKLRGCLHDVKAVENYLTQRTTFDFSLTGNRTGKIKKLTDEQATRHGIANGFRQHLSQATKNDTVLFYYSGHGTQEQAHAIWEETDRKLECLVCYDGGTTKPAEFLLTDKELRFLIHELYQKTGAHIVTLFDCCHSGDNTRNAALVEATHEDVLARRLGGSAFPMRNWSDFMFSDTLAEADVAGKRVMDFLPQGAHIQMAACESNQTAVEVAGEGIFTKTLLKTLTDAAGNLSYNTLRSRIRQYMRAGYEQTPRVYAPIEPEKLLNLGVFNQPIAPQQTISEAVYNAKTGWQLNVGAIHGVDARTTVTLIDPGNAHKTIPVRVSTVGVFVDYTLLTDTASLHQGTIYKAMVSGLMTQELVLELQNHDGNPKAVEEMIVSMQGAARGSFSFGGEEGKANGQAQAEKDSGMAQRADYTFHIRAGEVYLTLPNDPYRPLLRPIPFVAGRNQGHVLRTMQHVSRWHFIKDLQNPIIPQNFPEQALAVELTRVMANGTTQVIDTSRGVAAITYEQIDQVWKGTIQLKITNITGQDLYVCAAYLSKEFGSFLDFLPSRVYLLPAGASVYLGRNGKDRIGYRFGRVAQEYNWPERTEFIKFISSTTEFDGEALTLEELPQPLTTNDIGKNTDATFRGDLDVEDDTKVTFDGWITQTIRLNFKNPVYNQPEPETLKALLEWEETAYFAGGLYGTVKPDAFGQPTIWELNEEISKGLKVSEEKKNIFTDFKLFAANQIESAQRRKRYRNLLKQDPNRLRIVAEGDSWFQYPILLEDTLDHLYKLYAIRSFAEAGDTLENYMKKREYLDAIGEENAHFFLVSGGGNDILGEQFEHFLRDSPDPDGTTVQKYFNTSLDAKLTDLESFYEDMFGQLLDRYPDLYILVHSYDYVIPLDTDDPINKKKSSWLGKYLIKRGIRPQTEREQCINFIMDEFNKRLKSVVERTNNRFRNPDNKTLPDRVSYIDVRTVVNRTSWFDEIHPTNEGFQLVANRFIEEIEEIRKRIN
ncbi:caspase family protein [Spirosoma fluviale]|uniref:Caspase domain-containing protein n=1 Tax=Spirosoma fluviale TaxID=1597977 RepID=A0A286GSK0_9BACT|nr:caspase family protein [Spirosoma fluviale]SOD98531.1 Caspase domain-containing protein [Spirosoma fluviale]